MRWGGWKKAAEIREFSLCCVRKEKQREEFSGGECANYPHFFLILYKHFLAKKKEF